MARKSPSSKEDKTAKDKDGNFHKGKGENIRGGWYRNTVFRTIILKVLCHNYLPPMGHPIQAISRIARDVVTKHFNSFINRRNGAAKLFSKFKCFDLNIAVQRN